MDPLSVTAGVIAVMTAALQSCRVAYNAIDKLKEAPQVIAKSKSSLLKQKSLDTLQQVIWTTSEPSVLDSLLQKIDLKGTLTSVHGLCDEFAAAIEASTRHSTEGTFSKRDRVRTTFHEPKLMKLGRTLIDYQQTVSLVVVSINLWVVRSHLPSQRPN